MKDKLVLSRASFVKPSIESMIFYFVHDVRGHSGSATFESKHILSRGDAHTHGIEVTTGNATYQWTAVSGSHYKY